MRSLAPFWMAVALGLALVSAQPAAAMTFERVADPALCADRVCLLGSGEIDNDTTEAFARALRAERPPAGSLLILESEGGALLEALELGVKIREARLSTHVQAYDREAGVVSPGGICASACAYVFLGGVNRSVGDRAKVGVHQLHAQRGELTLADGQVLMALIAVHLKRLGGSLDLLISAFRTPPQKMYWLSPSELTRFGVVTGSAPVMAQGSVPSPGGAVSAD